MVVSSFTLNISENSPSVASQSIQSVQQVISVEQVFGSPLTVLSENINYWASVVELARVNVREVLHFLSPYLLRRVWVGRQH